MTLMPTPDDHAFENMLAGYAAPVDDDGFSGTIIAKIQARHARLQRLKFAFLATGCFCGGVFAAVQFPSALALLKSVTVPDVSIASEWLIAAAIISAFIAWMALDNKPSGSF